MYFQTTTPDLSIPNSESSTGLFPSQVSAWEKFMLMPYCAFIYPIANPFLGLSLPPGGLRRDRCRIELNIEETKLEGTGVWGGGKKKYGENDRKSVAWGTRRNGKCPLAHFFICHYLCSIFPKAQSMRRAGFCRYTRSHCSSWLLASHAWSLGFAFIGWSSCTVKD